MATRTRQALRLARTHVVLAFVVTTCLAQLCFSQPTDWTGAASTDWNDASNWTSGVPVGGSNVLVGINGAVTNSTIDLGGITTADLNGDIPPGPNGVGLTDGNGLIAPVRFGEAGGHNEYTLQNGTVLTTAAAENSVVWVGENLTVNWNVNVEGQGSFYQVGDGSTLNIGAGATTEGKFASYVGGANDSAGTVNLNAENFAADQPWLVGSANAGETVSTARSAKYLDVNVNADQSLSGGVYVGYTFAPRISRLTVRNDAEMVLTNVLSVGNSSSGGTTSEAVIQVGDATTTGYLELSGSNLRLGADNWGAFNGATGTLDIINGTVFLNDQSTVELGYGKAQAQALSQGNIWVRDNGTLLTQANFAERAPTGRGFMYFDGGTLKVDSGADAAQLSNLIDAGVPVIVEDGGMTFDTNGATDSTIAGPMVSIGGLGGLTVVGGGSLSLTGANSYVGDTVVEGSTLNISSAYLEDAASVRLSSSAVMDLNFAGTDTIRQLFFDGSAQAAGTWGAIGSGADHESSHFTGSGLLQVTVPEPSTMLLLLGAVCGIAALAGRK